MNSTTFNGGGMRIGIFVIAYNAERHIQDTLSRIPDVVWREIEVCYVVDDASTDETTPAARAFGRYQDKMVVLRNPVNRRYGGNQKFGYQWAIDRGLDVVVMLHADGQYTPEKMPDILGPLVRGEAEVVFGSRMIHRQNALAGGMPRYKYIGNIVLTQIENMLTGMSLSEFHSGYRAYSVEFLKAVPFWENSDEWHFDTQILLQAHQAGVRIHEVPIPTFYGDEICHVNGTAYGINCIFSALFFRLQRAGVVYSRVYDLATTGAARFQSKLDDPGSVHSLVRDELPSGSLKGASVLVVSEGDMTLLKIMADQEALVDVVALNPAAAELASEYARKVFVLDIGRERELELDQSYDIVLALDVLNYVVYPEQLLASVKRHCNKDARMWVSVPNFNNVYVRLNLFAGRLPFHSKGLLDRSQLRIFNRTSMRRLLGTTGWIVQREAASTIPLLIQFPFMRKRGWRWVPRFLMKVTAWLPGLLGYQCMFTCRNPNWSDKAEVDHA